ncbi:hypothetical protein [Aeoliella mucimassa]|uniref:hypothetical protein n=1 Tax=Aeoliella mucimassa TaxID=2527972 RepID=UPI00119D9A70|nr:hypothetical protein [Aeoliella mucimassa]
MKILRTLQPVLAQRRPVIRCEVFRKLVASERYALHDFFVKLGYEVVRYMGIEHGPGGPVSRKEMTETKHFDVMAVPRAMKLRRAA